MELNIKLIGNIGRLNKREPFILADNEKLVLNFSCATPLTDYYIELKNGDKSAKYRLNAGTVITLNGDLYEFREGKPVEVPTDEPSPAE